MSNNEKKKDLVQGWLDRQALNAIKMSEDESYRQLVAVRATNWGKDIQAKSDQRIRIADKEKRELASNSEINW